LPDGAGFRWTSADGDVAADLRRRSSLRVRSRFQNAWDSAHNAAAVLNACAATARRESRSVDRTDRLGSSMWSSHETSMSWWTAVGCGSDSGVRRPRRAGCAPWSRNHRVAPLGAAGGAPRTRPGCGRARRSWPWTQRRPASDRGEMARYAETWRGSSTRSAPDGGHGRPLDGRFRLAGAATASVPD
jgi:hypothetical protein